MARRTTLENFLEKSILFLNVFYADVVIGELGADYL